MLRSRTFLTTSLGLIGAIVGFSLSVYLLISGVLRRSNLVNLIDQAIAPLVGDTWSAVVFAVGLFLLPTLGLMFVGFALAKRLAITSTKQPSNKTHPLD